MKAAYILSDVEGIELIICNVVSSYNSVVAVVRSGVVVVVAEVVVALTKKEKRTKINRKSQKF